METYEADCVIAGGRISGIVTALELLHSNLKILLLDRDQRENFGGLAKESFEGIFFINSPNQKSPGSIQSELLSSVMVIEALNGKNCIEGLYSIGESAGFGQGGGHGKRALERAFLATCIYQVRKAAQTIKSNKQ